MTNILFKRRKKSKTGREVMRRAKQDCRSVYEGRGV
jgi:hypothetical protein